jgi:hypothetical protein
MKNHKAQGIPYEEMQAQQQTEIPPLPGTEIMLCKFLSS